MMYRQYPVSTKAPSPHPRHPQGVSLHVGLFPTPPPRTRSVPSTGRCLSPYLSGIVRSPVTGGCFALYILILVLTFTLSLTACGSQQQQPDPRLKSFHVVSARIIMLDTQAEVDGSVQNIGKDRYPYDVTLTATFYDGSGNVIGQAQGVAEDVWPGMTRPFVLRGEVDSAKYSRMVAVPVSLRERRQEKNLPSPPPVVP